MALTKNLSLIFKAVPSGLPIPGQHLVVEDRPIDLSNVPNGGYICRNLYASLDPYMRLMLIDSSTENYRKPFILGQPIRSLTIAEVLKSSNQDCSTGSLIRTNLPIQQYTAVEARDAQDAKDAVSSATLKILPRTFPEKLHPAHWLGPIGMPGLTAFSSIYEIGKPKRGETVYVSSAAGAVGQIVGQICKLEVLTVIGSAGTEEKVNMLRSELSFDAAFNYKNESTSDALARLAPEGIDTYFDNVGGEALESKLVNKRFNSV